MQVSQIFHDISFKQALCIIVRNIYYQNVNAISFGGLDLGNSRRLGINTIMIWIP